MRYISKDRQTLDESKAVLTEASLTAPEEDPKEEPEDKPEAPTGTEGEIDTGFAAILNSLIRDEWEAIDGYSSAIATMTAERPGCVIVPILNDIMTEEATHVGQLQKALTLIAPSAEAIKDGAAEAEKQLSGEGAAKESGGEDHED